MAEAHQQSWHLNKAWADGHLDAVRTVVRTVVGDIVEIVASSFERDTTEAIDYDIVVSAGSMSCRIRRAATCPARHLTMTTQRPFGTSPEAEKVARGDVRWYLYAWAEAGAFTDWMFVDLDVVRRKALLDEAVAWGHEKTNPDGSRFLFISFAELDREGAILRASPGLSR